MNRPSHHLDLVVAVLVLLVIGSLHMGLAQAAKRRAIEPAATVREYTPRDASLVLAGMLDLPGSGLALGIKGTTAYVAGGGGRLIVVDVSNPSAPLLISSNTENIGAYDLDVKGSILAVGDGWGRCHILDVTSPLNPVILTFIPFTLGWGEPPAAVLSPDARYLSLGNRLFDLRIPASPELVSSAFPRSIASNWTGNELFARAVYGSVWVVDTSNPRLPLIKFRLPKQGFSDTGDVYRSARRYYVGEYDSAEGTDVVSLLAYDAPQRGFPELTGQSHRVESFYSPNRVQLAGTGDLLVTAHAETIQLVNMSAPTRPGVLESVNVSAPVSDMKLANGHLYVLCEEQGLLIFRMETL